MKQTTKNIITQLLARYPILSSCRTEIYRAAEALIASFTHGGTLLACGNGGSAADCEHIVGELMKAFLLRRHLLDDQKAAIEKKYPADAQYLIQNLQRAVPAISLVSQSALMTAFANDMSADMVFAQQVLSYGKAGDILLAISTSGNSSNVLYAAQIAQVQGVRVIALTGGNGGKLRDYSDITICVPSAMTYEIQEYHLPVYHGLCACVENEFFGEG